MTIPVSFTTSVAGLKKAVPPHPTAHETGTTSSHPNAATSNAVSPHPTDSDTREETQSFPLIKPSEIMEMASHRAFAHIPNPDLPRTGDLEQALSEIALEDAAAAMHAPATTNTQSRQATANFGLGLPSEITPRPVRRVAVARAPRRQQAQIPAAATQHDPDGGRRPLKSVTLGAAINIP